MSRLAGFIYGLAYNHVDHLAPLCAELKVPLIVTEEEIALCCEKYYPGLELRVYDHKELAFSIVPLFDTIITTLPHDLFHEIFFFAESLLGKTLQTIWCPHGNSDKGYRSPFMEGLSKETHALIYGKKMGDLLSHLKSKIPVGNYRKRFAERHKDFYQTLLEKEIFANLPRKNRTILYAPTWEDAEDSSSFFSICPALLEQLPSHFNLIVKPHPNLKWQREGKAVDLLSQFSKENLHILWDFPPIYPLLEKIDIYLGDISSIGYDFLAFNRPMFFFRKSFIDSSLFLFRCGVEIPENVHDRIYAFIEETLYHNKQLSDARKKAYAYTFDEIRNLKEVYDAARSSR